MFKKVKYITQGRVFGQNLSVQDPNLEFSDTYSKI